MAVIDLTTQQSLKASYQQDPNTGFTTITLTDPSGNTTFGQIKCDTLKHRALVEALAFTAKEFFADTTPNLSGQKTVINIGQKQATTVFG